MDFESIWSEEIVQLDPPNRRGKGTSCVGIVEAGEWPEFGPHLRLYVKRQQAFFCRPAWNAFRSTPTLRREVRYLQRARVLGVSVPTIVRYEESSNDRAVLILEAVTGVTDLEQATEGTAESKRSMIYENVGKTLAKLHCARVLHGAVYPKHVLIETAAAHRVWLIDFEKARNVPSRITAARRDIARLLRHAPFMTDGDLAALTSAYDEHVFPRLLDRLKS